MTDMTHIRSPISNLSEFLRCQGVSVQLSLLSDLDLHSCTVCTINHQKKIWKPFRGRMKLLPSSNQTWLVGKWTIQISDFPIYKLPFRVDFLLPCLITRGYVWPRKETKRSAAELAPPKAVDLGRSLSALVQLPWDGGIDGDTTEAPF